MLCKRQGLASPQRCSPSLPSPGRAVRLRASASGHMSPASPGGRARPGALLTAGQGKRLQEPPRPGVAHSKKRTRPPRCLPPPPHLIAVGTVALAEDDDAVGGDNGPHSELQAIPVRELGLSRRRHGGVGCGGGKRHDPTTPQHPPNTRTDPFRSGEGDEQDRPIRREAGAHCQEALPALPFSRTQSDSL